ncbi:hypothetical protein [Amycolatopsis magusensis]|uniref:4-amino-4-deoxy-L-arabinose transferase n=1 Tax=Amycolatopsis magusensis TaxID=882444 RepID=A0ABS4PR34_9PSEU|nr:hypothetical protein [Amycolatopsis magusensis]MBP2181893.1 hypothetical protein [Amycolatopsis magusensis]
MAVVAPVRQLLPPVLPAAAPPWPGRRLRMLLHATWITALAVVAELRVGRFGFHPSDQGFVLAQSWRILHGEIPHADIVSARPLASALLHTVDFFVPGPLFVVSGVLSMLELTLATVALAALVTRRPVLTWGPGFTALVAGAALVNLNGFPMMAWHTIDGIALIACGAWALDAGLRSGRAWPRRLGLFLFGVAGFVKQGFLAGIVLAAVWLLLHPASRAGALRTWRWWWRTVADLLVLGAFPLAYVAVVWLADGYESMYAQVATGVPAYGERLVAFWVDEFFFTPHGVPLPHTPVSLIFLFAGIAGLLIVVRLVKRWPMVDRALVLAGTAAVSAAVWQGLFGSEPRWADVLWWSAAAALVVATISRRRMPPAAVLVVALGYMISLSWGVDTPSLLAGSLGLTAVLCLVEGMPPVPSPGRRLTALAGVVVLVAAGAAVVQRHDRAPYLDLPRAALTEDLGTVNPEMRGVITNPATHRYVSQLNSCLRQFPASKVAVLPDNAFAYPVFSLRNPYPLEWPLPLELVGDGPLRMIMRTEELNREGDYLVLFQTVKPETLAAGGTVPRWVSPDAPIFDHADLENDIRAILTGRPITCGSFVGKWAPAR